MDASKARRLVQAAAWRTHLTETDSETTEAFEAWLGVDPLNQAAWRQIQEPWNLFGEHANSPELIELRRAALGNAHRAERTRWLRTSFHGATLRAALMASVAIVAVAATIFWSLHRQDDYRTAVGERRVVTLSDGSKVSLDAQTEVLVSYSDKSRDLTLLRGQARFDVARDIERPFSVLAGSQKIIAIGTAFNVDLLGPKVLVTLIEGRVAVAPNTDVLSTRDSLVQSLAKDWGMRTLFPPEPSSEPKARPDQAIELKVGEQLVTSAHSVPLISAANVQRATAWQTGQLVFDNEPLSQVVERVNRYSRHAVEVADPETAALKISGVFNTGDVVGFVQTITHYLPVEAQTDDGGKIELRHR